MEKERKINWLGLFIKIIIIFVFILIIIWLISKITMKTRTSDTFKNSISNIEKVATNYFKEVDLPLKKGESLKITLGEMIDKGLITSENDKKESLCDVSKSFSKITRKKNNYVLSTTLDCGEEKSTITKKFSFKDCKNCNITENKNNKEKNKNKKSNSSNSSTETKPNNTETNMKDSSSNNTNNENKGTTYYEYVKETTNYTKWMKGTITGNNVENRYEYYGVANNIYYSIGIINESDFRVGNTINYKLRIGYVPNKDYYFSKIEEQSYFVNNDELRYIKEKNIVMDKAKYNIANNIYKYSLTSNNFIYKLSPYYRKGNFYIDVEITITSTENVIAYRDGNNSILFVPLKLNIKFASDIISNTIPNGEYETISYYRYIETKKDVIWSPENYVEGYTKTGRSETR